MAWRFFAPLKTIAKLAQRGGVHGLRASPAPVIAIFPQLKLPVSIGRTGSALKVRVRGTFVESLLVEAVRVDSGGEDSASHFAL